MPMILSALGGGSTPEHQQSEIWPSRSQRAQPLQEKRLLAEVEVIWLDPAAKDAPFLREAFTNHRPDWPYLRAYSVDSRGRVCRIFFAGETSWAAYRQLRSQGAGTCPIEGVLPRSIAPRVPALPAHPFLLKELGR